MCNTQCIEEEVGTPTNIYIDNTIFCFPLIQDRQCFFYVILSNYILYILHLFLEHRKGAYTLYV